MIFRECTITVVNDKATINKPLILYRGDKNIELKITIAESQFKFRNTDASNVIETTDASYAQLVINTPYGLPIFSDVAATKNGAVIFVITEAMIDEIREVGAYEIQIRLLDDNKQSRASIPPVSNAIEIREPIAIEDGSAVDSNAVNVAKVNRALTTTSAPLEAFDSQGNYIKKTWGDGDPITDAALNKMEAAIDGVNKKIGNNRSQIKDKANLKDLEVERKRIDSFTSLKEGSTTGDAELIDARIGADGFVYNNIGGAIRTQFDNINNEKVNKTDLYVFNMLNPNTITKDKYFEYGVEKDYTGWNVTDYIKIDNTKQYSLFIINSNNEKDYAVNVYVDQFNANKQYISNSSLKGKKLSDMTFTDDTVYIRVSELSKYICETGIICLTNNESYINEFISFGDMIDLKDSRFTNIEENLELLDYNNTIRSICRLGYDVYSSNTPPQQSIVSYKLAYKKGFRILLCDLRFTSDNVPVLHHDDNINTYAKNNDGTDISTTVIISSTTYSDLLNYDYGIYKGEQYKGTKIMHLRDMLKLCRNLGCELYIEVKSMNEAQAKIACDLVKAYRMEGKTSWAGTTPQMQGVINNIDTARVATMPQTIKDSTINGLNVLKTGKNEVFFFAWDTTELSQEIVNKLIDNDIKFEMGTLDTESAILNYFNEDIYYYCSGISSNKLIAGKVILKNECL